VSFFNLILTAHKDSDCYFCSFTDKVFVDASTPETINMGLKTIATTRTIGDSSQDALKWFTAKQESWLLFFDNADDPKIDLNKFLPKCNHGNIVITSRNPRLRGYGQHSQVSDMNETEAVELLLKCASQDTSSASKQTAAKIVKVCDPLIHLLYLTQPCKGTVIFSSGNCSGWSIHLGEWGP
jgi:hypothetical protein